MRTELESAMSFDCKGTALLHSSASCAEGPVSTGHSNASADSELELHSDTDCILAGRALTRWNVPTQCASVNTVRDLFKHAWLSFTIRYIRLI